MRLGALDLGSNSFHLLVVEARLDGSFVPLARDREMLRLGDLVARTGRIGEEGMDRAVQVVRRFKAIADAQRAEEVVALGTAALREASDGIVLADRVREATGIEIEVIDGVREAELVFRAVRSSVLLDPAPALCADLGGGSLELSVGDRSGLAFATSLRLGVGRLTAELVGSDPVSAEDLGRLHARVAGELSPVIEGEIAELGPQMLVGSSGTFACLARMAVAERDGEVPDAINQLRVPAEAFAALAERVLHLSSDERQRLPGCDARRAELVPAGLVVLEELFALTGIGELTLSEWALREGAVLEAIGAHDRAELGDDPRALRRFSVLSLCRRCGWRPGHARQVAALAAALFGGLSPIHHLPDSDRELLEMGALLHDIGEHVSRVDHDRHSAYLIDHGGLRGFSPAEVNLLAVLARFHVRGTPKASFDAFRALHGPERTRASSLVALLRLADALDASHAARVEQVDVDVDGPPPPGPGSDGHEVVLRAKVVGDAELEQWMFRRKKELFERLFGVQLTLVLDRSRPGALDLVHEVPFGLA